MIRKILIYSMLLALLSACGAPASTPTIDAASVQSTSVAAAFTLVAQTQAAAPTITIVPATETPVPTDTLVPSPTLDTLATPTVITLPTDLPTLTATPQASASDSNPCNHPLTSWQGPSASFTMMNETKPQGKVILMMSVTTELGECGWLHIYSDSFTGPVGNYSAGAFVDGTKDFKVFGAFRITEGGWKIVVRNDVITALGSCYPTC